MESLIKRLDYSNDKHLYSQLYRIRSEYIKNEEAIDNFTSSDGISRITDVLGRRVEQDQSKTNDKIIEVTLSILGNCTYNNENSAKKAFEANVIEHAVNIVNHNENPLILSKACRLIGNLAQFPKLALTLQSKGIALSMSNCLSEDSNTSVLTMAIRAIRLMWNAKRFRYEIQSFGSIYKIMVILYKMMKDDSERPEELEVDNPFVILKRKHEPDRAISKLKLNSIIEKMEQNDVEISYEISRPERKKDDAFLIPTEKESLDLVSGILKCLLHITATSISQVSRSVYADGFGITCLMFLAGAESKFRSMALKIISNMSSNAQAQGYLGINNDLVENISSMLLNSESLEKPLDTSEQKFCINILSLSSENACNRGKLRRSGAFKCLLDIANTTSCDNELALLIFTFFQFRFDQLGLDSLLELGFINVMIKILADLIKEKEVDHIRFDDPSLDEERKEEQKSKQKKRSMGEPPVGFNNGLKYMRYDPGSPSSSNNDYGNQQQYSPSRSSGYSPFSSPSRSFQDQEDSDSDIYSPVCSDNDEEIAKKKDFDILEFIYENDEIGASKESEKAGEEMMDLDDENSNLTSKENEPETAKTSKRSENLPETLKLIEADPIQFVLQLLWKVSIKNSDHPAFVRELSLQTLHKVSMLVQRPNGKIFQILENILMKTRNFVSVLKQDFVFKIHELSRPPYDHDECYSCSRMKVVSRDLRLCLGSVAESGYGRGVLAHHLLHGDDDMNLDMKKKVAINLTHLISFPEYLNDFLFKYRALDTVMEIILKRGSFAAEACNGMTLMSNNLNIQIPSDDDVLQKIIPEEFEEDEDLLKSDGELVNFILKDGETKFDKETLKKSSDVFHSMLSGDFRESSRNEVKFPDYSVAGMRYFFQIVKMDQEGKLKPIAPRVNDMNVILQAYELSILYIISNIQKPLLNVIKIVLDETSVLKIFEWSLKNINQELLISAICYFLCANIDGETKLKLFQEANQSIFKNEWKQLLVDTILMKCQPSL